MKKVTAIIFAVLTYVSALSQDESKFLHFSDVHFDPFYDTTIIYQLIQSDHTGWEKIFRNSTVKQINSYNQDSNFPLFISALEDMRGRIEYPDFIMITGDFMSHNFNENYYHYSGNRSEDSLNIFIEKTIKFTSSMILKFFPESQIFPMLGNDDAYCGNYMVDPGGPFLKMVANVWEPFVNYKNSNEFFEEEFSKGGYAVANFLSGKDQRLFILNTIYFSVNYRNLCGDTLKDPGMEELVWLRENLQKCREKNCKAWLSYHIPSGADVYGSIHGKGNSCEEKIFMTWDEKYSDEFLKLMDEYSDVINAGFAGHFHRDDFRITNAESDDPGYILIAPSISPIYDNKPSYRIFTYGKDDLEIYNYETYYISNFPVTEFPVWEFEYDFRSAYRQNVINAASLFKVRDLINTDTTYRQKYIRYYTSGNELEYPSDYEDWHYNFCAFSLFTRSGYTNCICSDSK